MLYEDSKIQSLGITKVTTQVLVIQKCAGPYLSAHHSPLTLSLSWLAQSKIEKARSNFEQEPDDRSNEHLKGFDTIARGIIITTSYLRVGTRYEYDYSYL
jgi:hypothetical protein